MRTSWNQDALYLGFKAGSASSSGHGHMDGGSFIMESEGVRWASDLGMQDYESLESKGMDIFGKKQDAQRWTVYRMNSYSHNILTVDSLQQRVDGKAFIDKFSDSPDLSYAISDLSSLYAGQLAAAKRGAGIVKGKYVVIQDELTAPDKQVTVRWAMLTAADVKITGDHTATLMKDGKKLMLNVTASKNVKLKTWSTAPTNDFDAPNPGTVMVGFEIIIPANEKTSQTVFLIPGNVKDPATEKTRSLDAWR
jgi:hypothetical protein